MHSTLLIRRAVAADARFIAAISRQTFFETFAAFNSKEDMDLFLAEQFTQQALEQEVREEPGSFFLAYEAATLVGYMRLRTGNVHPVFEGKPALELARIYVLNTYQGRGIGTMLMQEAIAEATLKKAQILWLGVWEKNFKAISFYQQLGFTRFGAHEFLLGKDVQTDWLLQKLL